MRKSEIKGNLFLVGFFTYLVKSFMVYSIQKQDFGLNELLVQSASLPVSIIISL